MLSSDLKNTADTLMVNWHRGEHIIPDDARRLATAFYAMALTAEALEATKVSQEVADEMARIFAEQMELRS